MSRYQSSATFEACSKDFALGAELALLPANGGARLPEPAGVALVELKLPPSKSMVAQSLLRDSTRNKGFQEPY